MKTWYAVQVAPRPAQSPEQLDRGDFHSAVPRDDAWRPASDWAGAAAEDAFRAIWFGDHRQLGESWVLPGMAYRAVRHTLDDAGKHTVEPVPFPERPKRKTRTKGKKP